MAEQSLWQRFITAVNREYDRRIRRASLVTEYGVGHHHAGHDEHDAGHHEAAHDEHDEGAAEIVNVPKGTPIGRHARPTPEPETETSS